MSSLCPICNCKAEFMRADSGRLKITCQKCGTYAISEETVDDLPALLGSDEYKCTLLSHKVCRSQDSNKLPFWTYELCDNVIKNHSLPDVYEQIDGVLEWIGRNSKNPGCLVNLQSKPIEAFCRRPKQRSSFFRFTKSR